ncbi:MAG: hypothetical protein E6881_19095, partial [Klebsiella michiganensis]|nr:hypothetical protein [Klebsiella michiganensis]
AGSSPAPGTIGIKQNNQSNKQCRETTYGWFFCFSTTSLLPLNVTSLYFVIGQNKLLLLLSASTRSLSQ